MQDWYIQLQRTPVLLAEQVDRVAQIHKPLKQRTHKTMLNLWRLSYALRALGDCSWGRQNWRKLAGVTSGYQIPAAHIINTFLHFLNVFG